MSVIADSGQRRSAHKNSAHNRAQQDCLIFLNAHCFCNRLIAAQRAYIDAKRRTGIQEIACHKPDQPQDHNARHRTQCPQIIRHCDVSLTNSVRQMLRIQRKYRFVDQCKTQAGNPGRNLQFQARIDRDHFQYDSRSYRTKDQSGIPQIQVDRQNRTDIARQQNIGPERHIHDTWRENKAHSKCRQSWINRMCQRRQNILLGEELPPGQQIG